MDQESILMVCLRVVFFFFYCSSRELTTTKKKQKVQSKEETGISSVKVHVTKDARLVA